MRTVIGIPLLLIMGISASEASLAQRQGSYRLPTRVPPPGREQELLVERSIGGEKVDYKTTIRHQDGRITTVEDDGDVRIVDSPGGTPETLGRGISHREALQTQYRPESGDVILQIVRFKEDDTPEIMYDRNQALRIQAESRAFQAEQAAKSQREAALARIKAAKEAEQARIAALRAAEVHRQQVADSRGSFGGSHDRDGPDRSESRGGRNGGIGDGAGMTAKPK